MKASDKVKAASSRLAMAKSIAISNSFRADVASSLKRMADVATPLGGQGRVFAGSLKDFK
ncbi:MULTISPECIES: hypothetical protein [Deefgea]|uniref:Phage tail tape measure protein n=1 Tax=Deefgea chitinilytica TaxID=570276 RepID=A0ABS2CAJ9_9NEIS|nr:MULTISPECIES: hypothetical protein [Deefgea]MBM5571077.1 hypothetical protein [Deefgea chitinilytica]MBM9888307.1 hypothetical protein [Deefgea sp. CFH1-16]